MGIGRGTACEFGGVRSQTEESHLLGTKVGKDRETEKVKLEDSN